MQYLHQDSSLDVDYALACKYRFTLTNQDGAPIEIHVGDVLTCRVGKPNSAAEFVLSEDASDYGIIEVIEIGEDEVTSAVIDVTLYGAGTELLSPNDAYVADLILQDAITGELGRLHRLALPVVDVVGLPDDS